ncbi:hypothetical protein Plhal304r1_c076g0163531 [Plasmopara halstedii]
MTSFIADSFYTISSTILIFFSIRTAISEACGSVLTLGALVLMEINCLNLAGLS